MRKRPILYALFLVVILMSSCIKDDMDDCPPPVYSLYFSYKGDGTKEIFLEKEKSVNLYIYDDKEVFVRAVTLNQDDLKRKQGIDLDLPYGKYKIVCWGNVDKNSQMTQSTSLDSLAVGAPAYFKKERITTNDSLYYATKDINIIRGNYVIDTVKFKSAHIKMQIVLSNLDQATITRSNITKSVSSDPNLSIEIGNLKPTVTFKENYSKEKVSYYPLLTIDNSKHEVEANFNVLRFNDDNDVFINIRNSETNDIIYSLSVMQFMRKYGISEDGKNEVPIRIRFSFRGFAIAVEPWGEEEIKPGV
ncbi:FimB/Mfa2 family fimbrial subunit [Dysgonomonas alginatilytica]|nr:FimB/Mfa2 family fimbrial subunit [Dysgonomonas alginatilytica]